MRVKLTKDEWYPIYALHPFGGDYDVEVEDEAHYKRLLAKQAKILKEFDDFQKVLENLKRVE